MRERIPPQSRTDLGPDASWLESDDSPEMVELTTEVRKRLMSEPYLEASGVGELLGLADVEPLVTDGTLLAYKDHGDYLFPAFQFDSETRQPIEVVSSVNRILDAPNDGWGVTAWWVQTNGRLGESTAPLQLLPNPSLHPVLLQLADDTASNDSY